MADAATKLPMCQHFAAGQRITAVRSRGRAEPRKGSSRDTLVTVFGEHSA
jgi:hypothetical protein